jgi:hypothetical protein
MVRDVAAALAPPRTPEVAAYDRYLTGRYFWNRRRLHESIAEAAAPRCVAALSCPCRTLALRAAVVMGS